MRDASVVEGISAPSGPYSHAVSIAPGRLICVSGLGPFREDGSIIGTTVEEQVHATLDNLAAIASAYGLTLDDVARTTVYLADLATAAAMNRVYRERFSAPYAARTTIGCQLAGIQVEIDALLSAGGTG